MSDFVGDSRIRKIVARLAAILAGMSDAKPGAAIVNADAAEELIDRLVYELPRTPADANVRGSYIEGRYPTHRDVRLLRRPDFQSQLRRALQARILGEGAALAVQALIEIVQDADTVKSTRVDAAKALLAQAGVAAPTDAGKVEVDLSSMSRDELMRLANSAEGELAARATPVSAPASQDNADRDLDIFG